MIDQRLYPDIALGFGKLPSQSIAKVGCFQEDILQGLLDAGYKFTVAQFNDYLKDRGIYTTGNPTGIVASQFPVKCSDIFLEGRNEPWNDAKLIGYLSDESYIVIGEVDARGIGGSGQHFVRIIRVDVLSTGKIGMTYIDDPWGGLSNRKVTERYNAYGNILSLRIFKIIKKGNQPMPETITVNKSDWERVLKASQQGDKLIQGLGYTGNIADKSDADIKSMIDRDVQQKNDLQSSRSEILKFPAILEKAKTDSYNAGLGDGKASVPNQPIPSIPADSNGVDLAKYRENGVTVEIVSGNRKVITNYALK